MLGVEQAPNGRSEASLFRRVSRPVWHDMRGWPCRSATEHLRLSVGEAATLSQSRPVGTLDFLEEPIRD